MKKIIELRNATKSFKGKIVFSNLNLICYEGKSYGFVGYNGCGKSVLFKCICGFSLLTSGVITFNDKIIGKDCDFIMDAGVVIENPSFIPEFSGYQNLKMLAQIKKQIGDLEINEILQVVDLFEDRNKKVSKYSLGMKQKLRIAQALMEKPKILILDEPMNGLDKKSVILVRELLKSHVSNGGVLLLTSHNKDDIDLLCDAVYEFEEGQLIEIKKDDDTVIID